MNHVLNHTNFQWNTWRLANRIQRKLTSALVSVVSSDVIRLREIDRKIRSLFISVDTSLVSKGGLERSQITELNRLKWTLWESEEYEKWPDASCVYLDSIFLFFHHFSRDTKTLSPILYFEGSKNISNLTFLYSYTFARVIYILQRDNSDFFTRFHSIEYFLVSWY